MPKVMMAALFALLMFGATFTAQDTLKIGYIDPLSGGGASVGEKGLKTFQFLAGELNAKGGVLGKQVEIVPYDDKLNPQESLIQAQKAIDAGIRILTQGAYQRQVQLLAFVAAAADKAKSLEPVKIALALEGMQFDARAT